MGRRKSMRSLVFGFIAAVLSATLFSALMPQAAKASNDVPWLDSALVLSRASNGPFVSVSNSSLLPNSPVNSDFTVEVWAQRTGSFAANTKYYLWGIDSKGLYVYNNTFYWAHDDSTSTSTGVSVPNFGEWFHVAIVCVNSTKTIKLVLNGTSTSWSKSFTTLIYNGSSAIGGASPSTPYDAWNGLIDQFKVYNSALSDAQIAQSMNTYSNVGIAGSPTLSHHISFNDKRPNSQYTDFGLYNMGITPSASTFVYQDVKTIDTTSRPGKTIYVFPRTYLTPQGGWQAPVSMNDNFEYLAVGGGGGGGGNRGGGGGAGGLLTGTVKIATGAAYKIVVGAGGYSAANGGATTIQSLNGTSASLNALGGGAGGTHTGTASGATGGSGGGTSLCGLSLSPTGGAGTAGQGFAGASSDTSICGDRATSSDPYPRSTGGGGGSSAAGVLGKGTTSTPTATTPGDIRPDGGAGTSNSISGTATVYAAGGGGAIALGVGEDIAGGAYASAYFGLGGSSIGGDGALVGANGNHAAAGRGSGGGGGGATAANPLTSGGFGSAGVVYLVATPGITLTTAAAGAELNTTLIQQPTFTTTGAISLTGCSATDLLGSSSGVSVTCSAVSGTNSISLTDLKFTTGTAGTYYLVTYTFSNGETVSQEIPLLYIPASIVVATATPSSNVIWDRGVPMATAASAAIQIVNTTTNTQFSSYPVSLVATGSVTQNSSATITGATAGLPLLIKGLTISSSANITTANAPVTIWATNANSATGTTGATGVSLGSNVTITTAGGAITIGGGANPASSPVTAEKAISFGTSANLNAGGGNISIRGDAVYNSNLSSTTDNEMWGVKLAKTTVQTVGSGTITIVGNGQGSTNGRLGFGVGFIGTGSNVTAVDGNISITGGNLGSANVNAIYADSSGAIRTTGTGSISITGDGRGTTTTATALASSTTKNYGVGFTGTLFDVTTVDGSISITGYAGSHAAGTSGSNPVGVWLESSTVKSTGIGTVSVSGFGGDVGSPTTAIAQTSTGVYSSSLLNTTTGAVSISGLSGSIANSQGADPLEIGLHFKKGTTSVAGLGSLQTTSGSITVTGDTSRPEASAIRVIERGIYVETGLFINSTSGDIQVTGSACSTCSPGTDPAAKGYGIDWTAGTNPTWSYIATSGAGTINMVGRADNMKTTTTATGLSYGISFVSNGTARNTISSDSGAVSITGSVTAPGGSAATGVDFITAKINTNSGAISVTGTGSSTTALAYGVNFTTANFTSQTGAVNLTGLANTTTAGGYGFRGNVLTVSTLSSPISISGELAATTASGGATYYGTYLTDSSATSGNSSTPTTGGQISIVGKSPDFTIGTIYGVRIDNTSSVDTYNGDIVLTSNTAASQAVSNPSRTGMWFAGTLTLAASAANLTINNYAGAIGSRQIWLVGAMNFTIGSATSHVNVVVNSNAFSRDENGQSVNFIVDTDGTYSLIPYANSFFADVYSITAGTGVMQTLFAPTARVSAITLGKSGNTRAITINKPFPLSTTSGHLKVYGGNIVSTQAISANTLALDSSGTVQLSNVANDFRNVAVRRANATGFSLVNAATSWTAGTYDSVVGVYGVPSTLKASGTPPSTVQMGSTLATYSVIAADGYGDIISAANTRSADALSVTTSVKSGATTTLGGTTTQTGTAGAAIGFNDLTFSNPGVHTLAFDATNFTQYVSPNITVSGGTPTISLSYYSGTNSGAFVSASTTISPTATTNTTGTKTYSTSTAAVCSVVSTTGVVTTKTPGTCTITLQTAADSIYLAGTTTIDITIAKTAQPALVITSTSGSYGAVLTLATSGATVGALTYSIDAGSTCTFATANVSLNLGAVGSTCMVTATRAGDATYAAVSSISTSIATNKGTQAGLVTPSGITISYLSAGLDLATLTYSGGSGGGAIGFSTSTTGCSINGTVLTSTNQVGGTSCSISAVKAGDDSYNTGSPSVFSVAIAKANQAAITVTSTSATYGQGLSLTYSGGSSTGAVSFSVVSGSCTIAGTTLTPTAATSCVIKVTKALDTNYNVVTSADTTVNIAKGTQAALTISSTSGAFGGVLTLTTAGGTDNGAVTYVVDSGTCSLATASTLNLGAVGDSCMVTATKAATANYDAVSSTSTSIATVRANQATLVAPSGVTLTYGDTNGLDLTTVTFTGGSGTGSMSFSTATNGCAIASNVLTSTNDAATTCVVASTKAGDSSYNTGTAVNLTVTIAKANQAPLVISTTVGTYATPLTLSTTGGTDNGAVTYAKDSGTCTLASGVVTLGNAATTCYITATKAATTNYNSVSSISTSIITNKATQTTLVITSTVGTYNTALNLTTSGGTDTGAVTYAVDSGTCVVNGSTLTLGNAGDSCFVTATKATTTNYLVAVSVSTSISTGRATQAALVAPTGTNLTYGDTTGINLTALSFTGGSGTGSLIFSTSTSGCAISGSNVLTSTNNAATTCVVATNKAGDNNFSAGSPVNLTVTIVKANQSTLTVTSTSATYPVALSLTTSGGDGDGAVTFSVVSGACTISSATLTPTGATSCVIRATKATSTNFNATTSADATVTIAKGTQTSVTITSASTFAYAGTLTLTSSGGSSGATGYVYATSTTGCSISNGVLSSTLGATSTCAITSYKAGDANWNDSTTVSQTVTIVKANQATIMSVPTGVTITYNNQTGLDLTTLAITGGDGTGAYQYTATTAGCNIASNVLTTANLANTSCLIDVVKAADANYNASPVGVLSVAIVTANQPAITVTTTSATFGQTLTVQFTGGIGTGAVTYSATGTCSVDSSGVLSVTAAGATGCSVTVSKAAEPNKYNSATSVATTVAVAKGNQAAVSFTSGNTIQYAGSLTLTASGGSSTANGYVFSTSTTNCAVSGATLTSTLPATNSCAVSVYKLGDSNWNDSATATATITIAKANQAALVVPTTTNITFGDTNGINLAALTITGGTGTGSISFASGTAGCSIATATLTTTNDAGTTCTVVTTKAGDANYNASTSVNMTVTIIRATQAALTITATSGTYGQTLALTTSGGTDTGAVTYLVNSGTCSVNGSTLTLGNAGSSCMVTATKAQTTNYNAISSISTSVATVRANQAAVIISSSNSIEYGGTLTLTATGGSSSSSGYVFATSTTGCTVTGTTLSTTLGATSTCAVTAYKAADSNWNVSSNATQTVTVIKASQANALTVPTGVTMTYLNAGLDLTTLSYSGGNGTGAYTFSTSTAGCVISVSNVLTSTNNASTNCLVDVVKAADANYNASPAGVMQVAIVKANQAAINVTSLAATYGATLALTSTGGTSNGAVTFTKVSGSCTISGAVLTPTGAGNCVITATMAGGNNYNDVTSANATVVIAKANQSALTFSMATSVPYLGSLALTTNGGSGTGNVVFSVTAGSACTVNASTLSPSTVGSTCEVLATKLGDSNYNSVDATSQVITTTPIAQASITFSNAAVMTYGQTLTLNATGGSGSGAISYSVNNAGTTGCTLSGAVVSVTASGTCVVSAVKAASTNYIVSTTVNQSITVNKAVQTITFTSTMPASPMVGNTYAIAATSTSGAPVVFSTSSSGCTISGSTVTFIATGNCRVDANAATTTQYQPATTANQTINVGQRNQVLTFDAATLAVTSKTFGDPAFAIAASSSVAGLAPVYSRGAATTNNACLVSTSGLVTIVAVGVCQIQADQPGDANTSAANPATANFNVVADTANAPTIVSVSAGDQSITAAFVKPSYTGGAVITGYQLVATHAGGQVTYTGCPVVAGNDQSCTIGGLTNGTPYTVKVAAINSAGTGLQSVASASRVPATNPAAVTAFTAVPDNTTLKLAWSLPVSLGGGVFDSYRIFIKPSSDANYPTTYITVNSQSIFDYTFTNLVNGQAYDAMIVTVTTANTLSLVSNTAEVRETPRTVPDAPASILIFEVGANLVISWTSPVSDGGNAISEYAASIGGTPCVLATPLDTTCSITTPTTPGDYPIEVKAKNAAGLGEAVTGRFTKAAAPVPPAPPAPPVNGGNEYVANPRIPMLVLGLSSGKVSTAGGQILTLTTKNMSNLTEVTVDGVKVKILSTSATQVKLQMPKHAAGPVTIRFVAPNGSLDFVGVTYASSAAVASSGKVTIRNFIQENATLSAAAKASLRSVLAASPGANAVTCIGYQSWSYDRPLDAQTALQRAQVACNYLKSIKKSLVTKTAVARTSLTGPASRKLEVLLSAGR